MRGSFLGAVWVIRRLFFRVNPRQPLLLPPALPPCLPDSPSPMRALKLSTAHTFLSSPAETSRPSPLFLITLLLLALSSCCVWAACNMWYTSEPSLPLCLARPLAYSHIRALTRAQPHSRTHSRCAVLLENVQREEVGCPSSRDLGQRKAGDGRLLCSVFI